MESSMRNVPRTTLTKPEQQKGVGNPKKHGPRSGKGSLLVMIGTVLVTFATGNPSSQLSPAIPVPEPSPTGPAPEPRRNPARPRQPPDHLKDYVDAESIDSANTVDYC
eukprot:gene1269-1401_t